MNRSSRSRSLVKAVNAVSLESLEMRRLLSAPLNDMFADAVLISSFPATVTGTNLEATTEAGEPAIYELSSGYSVWWKWTADASEDVEFDTAGSDFDTVMAVFTGDLVSNLSLVTSNDDSGLPEDMTSLVTFSATAGTTYYVGVDGFFGDMGNITLNGRMTGAPSNDMFVNAEVIPSLPAVVTGANFNATSEEGEAPITDVGAGYSVWWKWTADATGDAQFDTTGSDFDTVMAVFAGDSVSNLSLVGENDDFGESMTSLVSFGATAGTTYYIAIDFKFTSEMPGNITLSGEMTSVVNQPPSAQDDSITTNGWIARTIPVLNNDSDPEGDTLTIESLTNPSHGSVVLNEDGTITYSAEAGYIGDDAFTYTINDGNGNAALGNVSISVTIPSIAHVAFSGTNGDDNITVDVANDVLQFKVGGELVRQFAWPAATDITIFGWGGNDTIDASALQMGVTISGGAGDDVLVSSPVASWLVGGDGNDDLSGWTGNDTLSGGDGNDTISGGAGNDIIIGAGGADVLYGGDGNDSIFGGSEADSIQGEAGDDLIFAGAGNDTIDAGDGNDGVIGESGDDLITGGNGNDAMRGGLGNDTILGAAGMDILIGDDGADELHGGADSDLLDGRSGDDVLMGEDGADRLIGMGGNDSCDGGAGNDSLYGGTDNDTLIGNNGNDVAFGGLGDDSIVGGEGSDWLFGDSGNDRFNSSESAVTRDSVVGGTGSDFALADASDLLVSVESIFYVAVV